MENKEISKDTEPVVLKYTEGFYICGDILGGVHWDCPKCYVGTLSRKRATCGHCGSTFSFEKESII